MLVAIGYCTKDQEQAERLAGWMVELGPYPNHRLLVARDVRAKENVFANAGFTSVEEILITDDGWDKWPESCNNVLRKIGKHVEFGTKEPWLFLEPDCVPMREGWVDDIEKEYLAAQKPFSGDFVHVDSPDFVDHMSGVACYPGVLSSHAGLAYLAHDLAWDVFAADQILPRMHRSELILHSWNHEPFESWEQVEREIFAGKPRTVLFHADKSPSLIGLLRQRKGGVAPKEAATPQSEPKAETFDLFLKTFPQDYKFAEYCLRSIDKFCSGFRRVVIVAPGEDCPRPTTTPHILSLVPERENGYNWQQSLKLNADQYTDADYVLFCDSDTIFTQPVTPQTFMRDGKVMWLMTPFENAREDQKRAWIPVMTKWMGRAPEYEWMRRHPFMFPRWLFEKIRNFCLIKHDVSVEQYIMAQGKGLTFSEFNNAGFFAYEYFRERFAWVNTETDLVPELTTLQKWSRGGLTDEVKAEFEAILSGGVESRTRGESDKPREERRSEKVGNGKPDTSSPPGGYVTETDVPSDLQKPHLCGSSAPPAQVFSTTHSTADTLHVTLPQQVPWESKEQSLEEIRSLAGRLKIFATKPPQVRAVRQALHDAGVIQLAYRFKKRKGWRGKAKK